MTEMKRLLTLVLLPQPSPHHVGSHLSQICSFLFLAALTISAPGTPSRSLKPGALALDETSHELSSPIDIEKRQAISINNVGSPVRFVAIYYDLSGYIRILMPTLITPELLGLVPNGAVGSIITPVFQQFLRNPVLSSLRNWPLIGATASFADTNQARLSQLQGTVVNLCIDFNIMPYIRTFDQWARVATNEMNPIMVEFIRDYLLPYWMGSPSAQVVGLDPRDVEVEFTLVRDARQVAEFMTYVFSYLTPPPGSPSKVKALKTYNKNTTAAGNFTQVASLKTANNTVHLNSNITKRATSTCPDFYPNLLPFMQAGPMNVVGTETISCAA